MCSLSVLAVSHKHTPPNQVKKETFDETKTKEMRIVRNRIISKAKR